MYFKYPLNTPSKHYLPDSQKGWQRYTLWSYTRWERGNKLLKGSNRIAICHHQFYYQNFQMIVYWTILSLCKISYYLLLAIAERFYNCSLSSCSLTYNSLTVYKVDLWHSEMFSPKPMVKEFKLAIKLKVFQLSIVFNWKNNRRSKFW